MVLHGPSPPLQIPVAGSVVKVRFQSQVSVLNVLGLSNLILLSTLLALPWNSPTNYKPRIWALLPFDAFISRRGINHCSLNISCNSRRIAGLP